MNQHTELAIQVEAHEVGREAADASDTFDLARLREALKPPSRWRRLQWWARELWQLTSEANRANARVILHCIPQGLCRKLRAAFYGAEAQLWTWIATLVAQRPDYECVGCGACCEFPESWAERLTHYIRLKHPGDARVPAHVIHQTDIGRYVRMEGPRCAAFCGSVGKDGHCGVYANRPIGCEVVPVGSGVCILARSVSELPTRRLARYVAFGRTIQEFVAAEGKETIDRGLLERAKAVPLAVREGRVMAHPRLTRVFAERVFNVHQDIHTDWTPRGRWIALAKAMGECVRIRAWAHLAVMAAAVAVALCAILGVP